MLDVNEAEVKCETFDVVTFHQSQAVPDLSRMQIDTQVYADTMRKEFIQHVQGKLAAKMTSKTVHLSETVTFRIFVPETWVDHLMLQHPWIEKVLFWREIQQEEMVEIRQVSKTETVDFAAVVPELQIPFPILEQGCKRFDVYYTVL